MKKIISLIFACVMLSCLLTGCQTSQAVKEELVGTWTLTVAAEEEDARAVLEGIDLYEEEIALVDLTGLSYVQTITFNEDDTYTIAEDPAGDRQCVEAFYRATFEALYEGRASLNGVYEMEFDAMTWEEFGQFYAEMYGMENYEAMITTFSLNSYTYDNNGVLEEGEYQLKSSTKMNLVPVEGEEGYVSYELDGDTLTITYSDAVQTYTKAD